MLRRNTEQNWVTSLKPHSVVTAFIMRHNLLGNKQVTLCARVPDGWMIVGSSPGRDSQFFLSPSRPDWLWGPPSILSNG